MAHSNEAALAASLAAATEQIPVGSRWVHYRMPDQPYIVEGVAFLEASEKVAVIYRAEYGLGLVWVRALDDFLSEVEHEGKKVTRFTRKEI